MINQLLTKVSLGMLLAGVSAVASFVANIALNKATDGAAKYMADLNGADPVDTTAQSVDTQEVES